MRHTPTTNHHVNPLLHTKMGRSDKVYGQYTTSNDGKGMEYP